MIEFIQMGTKLLEQKPAVGVAASAVGSVGSFMHTMNEFFSIMSAIAAIVVACITGFVTLRRYWREEENAVDEHEQQTYGSSDGVNDPKIRHK